LVSPEPACPAIFYEEFVTGAPVEMRALCSMNLR
jgi:hypothetical protein